MKTRLTFIYILFVTASLPAQTPLFEASFSRDSITFIQIDTLGERVSTLVFDEVGYSREEHIAVRIQQQWGYVDYYGNFVIPLKYRSAGNFSSGIAPVSDGDHYYLINQQDETLSEKYDTLYRSGGFYIIKSNGLFGFLDSIGNLKQEPIFEKVDYFFRDKISVKYNSKWISWSEAGIDYHDVDLYFHHPEIWPAYDESCIDESERVNWFDSCSRRRMLSEWNAHVHYPQEALEQNMEGKVWVQFIINQRGQVEDIELIRGIGAPCDNEVLEALSQIDNWIRPGSTSSGRYVKTIRTEYISFRIE